MQQLSVSIVRDDGVIQFSPRTLQAFTGDQIFWVNNDLKVQQPAAVNPDLSTTAIVDPIEPGDTSGVFSPSPMFDDKGKAIAYTIQVTSLNYPAAESQIVVSPNP